ncbi:MAG: hypothetical protein Q7T45_23460 [Bradyrhizobium sp.]|uniref:ComEC/Rec2 family competence protein n=1 Tax=Bradyrhizobium sp. TaxID=376 RepID=UPI00271D7228|nr:hypothetical protein [Bradyrhizobium sp.]MDO8400777.1 hypothetical protein [Bradyrhizobium sp.]
MLTFHFLNVGQGSSTVIEFESSSGKSFAIIDSNLRAGETEPRGLIKLRELGASHLAFAAMTHPHKDHYLGLFPILKAFSVDQFYCGPLGGLFQNFDRLKKFGTKLKRIINGSDGSQRVDALELLNIIMLATDRAKNKKMEWLECAGDHSILAPTGFTGVEMATILPPAKVKGSYVQQIERQDLSIIGTYKENEISLAFEFSYGGCKLIIGGDGTISNWEDRKKFERNRALPLAAQIVNLPHHGSGIDCPPSVITQLFDASSPKKLGITSANGLSHPSPETIQFLEKSGIKPYCTNLMPICGANAQQLLALPGLDPRLARWIREVAKTPTSVQTCQGDIAVTIQSDGTFAVAPGVKNGCAFRGDFAHLVP